MSIFDEPDTIFEKFGYRKPQDVVVVTCIEPLRCCTRCEHFPCLGCRNWCDVYDGTAEIISCPCAGDGFCIYTEKDLDMNNATLTWVHVMKDRFDSHCMTTDENGRVTIIVAADKWDPSWSAPLT